MNPLISRLLYAMSSSLSLVSPWQVGGIARQIRGEAVARIRLGGAEPMANSYVQQATYRLPFDGEWTVLNGSVTMEESHSWDLIAQRYAYDFVVESAQGTTFIGKGRRLVDYLCHGLPVLAPADGDVVHLSGLTSGHLPMVTNPNQTAALLASVAMSLDAL